MNYQQQYAPKSYSRLPNVIKNLLIINAIVFGTINLFQMLGRQAEAQWMIDMFGLHFFSSEKFKPWQVVTSMFMHEGFMHFFFNMFALWMFGMILENLWGEKKFLTFYFLTGIGSAVIYLLVAEWMNADLYHQYDALKQIAYPSENQGMYRRVLEQRINTPAIGASGAIFGILVAFGYLFPNTLLYFYFLIPIKTKWFVLGYVAFELYMAIQNNVGDNVAHTAHLGGALVGFLLVWIWGRKGKNFYK